MPIYLWTVISLEDGTKKRALFSESKLKEEGIKPGSEDTWIFRTAMVTKADGSRERLTGTPGIGKYAHIANTRIGAKEAERLAINEALSGKPLAVAGSVQAVPKAEKTIAEHAIGFVDVYKPETSEGEKRTKRRILENLLLPYFGEKTIEGLEQSDVDAWSAAERKRGMSIKSINNRLAVLSSLIKYRTGEKSKLRFKLKGPKVKINAVAMPDVEKLLAACTDDRYRAVILLATEAGLRAGEIRGLQWNDIRDGEITVRRQLDRETNIAVPPKHGTVRTIPVSERIAETLAALKRRGIWIVSCLDGELLGYDGMLEAVHALYDRANVARPKKAMHCLRHTFGTEMAKKVPLAAVRDLMGHADIATTMVYVDVNEEQKREGIANVWNRPVSSASHQKTQITRKHS